MTRRAVLGGLVATSGTMVVAMPASTGPPTNLHLRGTPQLNIGPFYPLTRPPEEDADLTRVAGRPGQAQGPLIELIGRVTDELGRPVAGAQLDMWQTNAAGRYHHPSHTIDLPIDPNFQGAAILRTDTDGGYRIRTVLPGLYAPKQRHIHFDIRGQYRRLITQMFFQGEPNELDGAYASLKDPKLQAAVLAKRSSSAKNEGFVTYRWDVILAGE